VKIFGFGTFRKILFIVKILSMYAHWLLSVFHVINSMIMFKSLEIVWPLCWSVNNVNSRDILRDMFVTLFIISYKVIGYILQSQLIIISVQLSQRILKFISSRSSDLQSYVCVSVDRMKIISCTQ
jgi:hypothetical protein